MISPSWRNAAYRWIQKHRRGLFLFFLFFLLLFLSLFWAFAALFLYGLFSFGKRNESVFVRKASMFLFGSIAAVLALRSVFFPYDTGAAFYADIEKYRSAIVPFLAVGIILFAIWLLNLETVGFISRLRRNERELKKERDQLELKVIERTEALKQLQLEKTMHLYRFAELGRITTGMFHDLVNPIAALRLHLEFLEKSMPRRNDDAAEARAALQSMQHIIDASRKQVQQQKVCAYFCPDDEILLATKLLEGKAQNAGVSFHFEPHGPKPVVYGNAIAYYRVVVGLLSNSIDAYASAKHGISTVIIRRNTDENDVLLTIQDFGPGIPQEIQKKIFEPLFTTKPPELGTGVGLAMSKTIVEKDFGGTLSFVSEENHGTSFMVRVPRFVEMEK